MSAPTSETVMKDPGRGKSQTEKEPNNAGVWGQESGLIATMREAGLIEGVDASKTDHYDIKLVEARIGVSPSDVDDTPLSDALHWAADAIARRAGFEARLQEIAKQPDGIAKVIEFVEKV